MPDTILYDSAMRLFGDLVTPEVLTAADKGAWPKRLWQAVEEAGYLDGPAGGLRHDRGGDDPARRGPMPPDPLGERNTPPLVLLLAKLRRAAGRADDPGPVEAGSAGSRMARSPAMSATSRGGAPPPP
jgi:hypothetical protein